VPTGSPPVPHEWIARCMPLYSDGISGLRVSTMSVSTSVSFFFFSSYAQCVRKFLCKFARANICERDLCGRGKELLAQRVCRWLVGRWPLRIYIKSTIKIHFLTPIAVDKFQLFKIKSKYATFNHMLINKRAMQHLKSTLT